MGSQRTGRDGDDIVLKVPVGTEIIDEDEETIIADLTEVGQRVMLAKGGNGGWGNLRFKSATNRAPARANPGQEGVERTLWLRLKLIADAGLLGLPNAGKSTFLAARATQLLGRVGVEVAVAAADAAERNMDVCRQRGGGVDDRPGKRSVARNGIAEGKRCAHQGANSGDTAVR